MRKAGAVSVQVAGVAVVFQREASNSNSQIVSLQQYNSELQPLSPATPAAPPSTSRPYTDEDETDRWEQQDLPLPNRS